MSHDTEAAYASSEVADIIMTNQNHFLGIMALVEHGLSMLAEKVVTNGRLQMV